MVNGSILTDKLLSYATDNLYLAVSDADFKRLILCQLLKVDRSSTGKKRYSDVKLSDLKKDVCDYIEENKLSEDVGYYSGLIFGTIIPLSSAIEKSFKLFREKMSAANAQQFFYGMMKAGGYITERAFSTLPTNSCRLSLCTADAISTDEKAGADERYITLNLIRDYFFGYEKVYDLAEQGKLFITNDGKYDHDEDALDDMFEFIEYMPEYYVSASRYGVGERPDKIITFKEKLPALLSVAVYSFKNELYPDVDISVTDWYLSDIRFSGYNKNTLIKLINDTANAWISYRAEKFAVSAVNKNYVQLVLKLMPDGKYVADMLLRLTDSGAEKVKLGNKLDKYSINNYSMTAAFGKFILSGEVDKLVSEAKSVLTGKTPFDPKGLSQKDSRLYPLSDVIVALMNVNGIYKDGAKAEAALYDKLYENAENALFSCDPFGKNEEGVLSLKMFLLSTDAKQVAIY